MHANQFVTVGLNWTKITGRLLDIGTDMPKQITDARQFLDLTRTPGASSVKIITVGDRTTKFKLRTTRYLYTLVVNDRSKASKITSGINQKLKKIHLNKKAAGKKN